IGAMVFAIVSDPRYWWGVAACVILWMTLNALQVRTNIEIAARLSAYCTTDAGHTTGESPMPIARYVPLIWGLLFVGIAIGLVIWVSGWWRYIPSAILLWLGWQSAKTTLFASDNEIKELTSKGPLSDETMRKFRER